MIANYLCVELVDFLEQFPGKRSLERSLVLVNTSLLLAASSWTTLYALIGLPKDDVRKCPECSESHMRTPYPPPRLFVCALCGLAKRMFL